jgi:hypothetical protein
LCIGIAFDEFRCIQPTIPRLEYLSARTFNTFIQACDVLNVNVSEKCQFHSTVWAVMVVVVIMVMVVCFGPTSVAVVVMM